MGRPLIDLTNRVFGRWTVLRRDSAYPFKARSKTMWICRCNCGVESSVNGGELRKGDTRSCGCLQRELITKRNTKHGYYGTPKYWAMESAKKKARRLQATPKWIDVEAVRRIYNECPPGHDVDHIIPLTSPKVCGLHWEGNLQYLPKSVNQSKKNRYWPDMPVEQEHCHA